MITGVERETPKTLRYKKIKEKEVKTTGKREELPKQEEVICITYRSSELRSGEIEKSRVKEGCTRVEKGTEVKWEETQGTKRHD